MTEGHGDRDLGDGQHGAPGAGDVNRTPDHGDLSPGGVDGADHAHGHGPPPGEPPGFFDKPGNVRAIFNGFYVVCALLVVSDFVYHRHIVHEWEELPAFYPLYGFVGIVLLVIIAKLLRRVAMRPEDYYDA